MPIGNTSKTLITIVGPTAVGKTALAIQLAQYFQTEIISADSRQFFREMSIGTAKPSPEELATAPHHFINSHSIQELFSTGEFEVDAINTLESIFEKHDYAILVGGSGLYINAVCNGLDELPETSLTVREELNKRFLQEGITQLRKELQRLDPEYFERVDQSNTQRVIRGLEFVLSTGKKLSSFQTNSKKERPFNIVKIGLNVDRPILYNQINKRVEIMMEEGLLAEVERLKPFQHLNALKTVGYSELFEYMEGTLTLTQSLDLIKQNTRRFAKRQLTWFRKDEQIIWFEPNQITEILKHINKVTTTPEQ